MYTYIYSNPLSSELIILTNKNTATAKISVVQYINGAVGALFGSKTYCGISFGSTLGILRDLDELHVSDLLEMILHKNTSGNRGAKGLVSSETG